MALVHVDGFEALYFQNVSSLRQAELSILGYKEIEGNSTAFYRANALILNNVLNFINYGINGYTYIMASGSQNHSFVTPLPSSYSKGILSFLWAVNPGSSINTGISISLRGGGSDLISIRILSAQSVFPNSGYVMELFVGGVQVGTFLYSLGMFNRWARWSLVWDTSGANISASLYRESILILSGIGGTQGSGVNIDSYKIRNVTSSGFFAYDSFTVWDNPDEDLEKATNPHWVGCTMISPDLTGTTNGDFTNFSGLSIPGSSVEFSSYLMDDRNNTGILTGISGGTVTIPANINYEIEQVTEILALSPVSYIQGVNLNTCSKSIISNSAESDSTSKDVSEPSFFSPIFLKDPSTNQAWQKPTKITILDPNGDGGFESGPTFADNGWEASSTVQATWECGALGAAEGQRGAYISLDGGLTDLSSVTLPASYYNVFLSRELTIPENVTQISLELKVIGGNTIGSDYMKVGLFPASAYIGYNISDIPYTFWCLNQDSPSPSSFNTQYLNVAERLIYFRYRIPEWRHVKTLPKRVNPGETYRLVFVFADSSGRSYIEGLAIDSIAIYGYSGSIANLSIKYTAT